jgi:hypothetical protein
MNAEPSLWQRLIGARCKAFWSRNVFEALTHMRADVLQRCPPHPRNRFVLLMMVTHGLVTQ